MILATTDIEKINKSEIKRLYSIYGDSNKKIDQKIMQSLSARYLCHIVLQNSIKWTIGSKVYLNRLKPISDFYKIIKKRENGDIYLDDIGLFVSLSHSDSSALGAVSTSKIGADIQIVKKYNQRIAKRYFSDYEIEHIEKAKDIDQIFSLVWSFKESLFKSGYVCQRDFWKNSQKDVYSLFNKYEQRTKLSLFSIEENSDTDIWITTKFYEDFVITGICNKKEAILLAI